MNRSQSSVAPVHRRYGRLGAWLFALVTVASAVTACTITTDPPPTSIPPTVTIFSPADGTSTSQAQIDVSGVVTSSNPITSVRVTNSSYSESCIVSGDQFICTDVDLAIGANTMSVRAIDAEGLFGSDDVTVNRADSLSSSIDLIADTSTSDANQVRLDGSFTSPSNVTSVTVSSDIGVETSCDVGTDATYACHDVAVSTGLTSLHVVVSNQNGDDVTSTIRLQGFGANNALGFDIALVFFEDSYSLSQLRSFQTAADRWESIVVGDLVSFPLNRPENGSCNAGEPAYEGTVDDLMIFVTSFTDTPGGLLGEAGPCLSRSSGDDAGTNAVGYMRFDTADLDVLEADSNLVETIVHEMGHVLGIGTNWEWSFHDHLDYEADDGSPDCATAGGFVTPPSYTGDNGVDAWKNHLGGSGRLPVEEDGGLGTQCGHWDEVTFGNELMTGYLDGGTVNPISQLTVRSLQDIGLTVEVSAADTYTLPTGASLRTQGGFDIGAAEILVPARGTIDPDTGEVSIFPGRE